MEQTILLRGKTSEMAILISMDRSSRHLDYFSGLNLGSSPAVNIRMFHRSYLMVITVIWFSLTTKILIVMMSMVSLLKHQEFYPAVHLLLAITHTLNVDHVWDLMGQTILSSGEKTAMGQTLMFMVS